MMPRDPDAPLARLRALVLDPRAHAALLTACAAVVILARAGHGPLANYDDAYYAEKAKQMLRTGDWLTPRFAGLERLDNPPLFLWLMAAAFAALGVNEFAAVMWSALSGVACVALTFRLARRLGFEAFEAWAAGLVLLATGYVLKYSNHAMLDVFMTALFLMALLAYRRAWEGERRAWVVLGVLTGLGVLTKSALGLFPLMLVALHAAWCRRMRRSWATGAWLAPLAAIAVLLPWYGYQLATHREAFVREHISWLLFQRGLGTGVESRSPWSPFGYVRELLITYWPWLPCAAFGLWLAARESFAPLTVYTSAAAMPREWKPRDSARLLLLWPVVVLAVLSAAHEQKLWYAMSVFPALALLSARALGVWVTGERARSRAVIGGFSLAAAAGAVLALTPIGTPPPRRPDIQALAEVARSTVDDGDVIEFAGGNYYSIAHQFVFYSDRLLLEGRGDPDEVRVALDRGRWALVESARYTRVTGGDRARYPMMASAGNWALVHVAPAPSLRVGPAPRALTPRTGSPE